MKTLPLNKGKIDEVVLVDDEDFEKFSEVNWTIRRHRTNSYARRTVTTVTDGVRRNKTVHLHREVLGLAPDDERDVDHINGNGLDNRKENLRLCTRRENHWNRQIFRGAFKGVRKANKSRWHARIMLDGVETHLGSFVTPEDAARAYDQAAVRAFGEFAFLNFQGDSK